MTARQTYAFGYKTKDAAYEALDDFLAADEMSACEKPEVEFYNAGPKDANGARHIPRYRITVLM